MKVRKLRFIAWSCIIVLFAAPTASGAWTNNIMLTGYWPPTGEMLTKFSTNVELNPDGWMGQNWQGRGYDVYSYFPTFDPNHYVDPKGTGDFEVDYQDTLADFQRIVDEIHPVAILSYGQGVGPWELEYRAINYQYDWSRDYEAPGLPADLPPDGSVPAEYVRYSTLPLQEIADAINDANIGVDAWVDWDEGPGPFLCGYLAYQNFWYQDLHSNPSDPYQCFAAGFTHVVGFGLTNEQVTAAADIQLLATMDYLDVMTIPEPSTLLLAVVALLSMWAWKKRFQI